MHSRIPRNEIAISLHQEFWSRGNRGMMGESYILIYQRGDQEMMPETHKFKISNLYRT